MREPQPHVFHGQTTSLCEQCLELVPAKVVEQDGGIHYLKHCPRHGAQRTLVSSDADYWRRCRDFLKPGDAPRVRQTATERGCPWDCGLCPDHEQHSCVALLEITDACNLECPVCYASSSPARQNHRSLAEIERMLATLVESEGEPDVVQVSGGEPSEHPQVLQILKRVRESAARHVMLNTNGVRIANDEAFAESLAALAPGFEVYLQFDALDDAGLQQIRGAGLSRVRRRALERLERLGLSTTLVVTVKRGVNDGDVANIVDFARGWRCVRGVNFQPVQHAGRNPGFDKQTDRIDLADIRRRLCGAGSVFSPEDVLPLPCNPEYIAVAYALRDGTELLPLTRLLPPEVFAGIAPNSIAVEKDEAVRRRLLELLSLGSTEANTSERFASLLCCLPEVPVPPDFGYADVFRVSIVQFLDRFNFCIAGVKRSCIHIVQPDGRIIPFDTFNMFYRDGASP